MNQQIIEILRDEFTPLTKKSNLIIIFTFASVPLVLFLGLIFSPTFYVFTLILILTMSLFVVGMMMISWKILRLLRKLGLFGVYQPFNDF